MNGGIAIPHYLIYHEDNRRARKMDANNEYEAVGKARERWQIPDDVPLLAILADEAEKTVDMLSLADAVHKATMRVFVAQEYAHLRNDQSNADSLKAVCKQMNAAYFALTTRINAVDEAERKKKKAG